MNQINIIDAPGGGRLDETVVFRPLRIAVLTVSDTRNADTDTSGQLLAEMVARDGHVLAARAWVKDSVPQIQACMTRWIADRGIDVVLSTGGTGLSARDVTPEAVRPLFDKIVDGFEIAWHLSSFHSVGLSTLQSRACAGLAGNTLIFCLPGSNSACKEGWDKIIRWQLDSRHRPCNFADLLLRLRA